MHSRSNTRSLALVVAVLGGAMAVTAQSEAAVVNITSGFGIGAVNGGVAAGSSQVFGGLFGTNNSLRISNGDGGGKVWSLEAGSPGDFVQFLMDGANPNIGVTTSANTMLDSYMSWNNMNSVFRNDFVPTNMASFGPGNYVAMRAIAADYSGWVYGYFEVTWDATTNEFYILSGAYESVVGQGIMTPSGAGAVPLPGAAALAACGLLGLSRRRRR